MTCRNEDTADGQDAVRVLIVDDEKPLLRQMEYLLEDAGFVPTCARTGGDALDLMDRSTFAVAILDIGLPDIDGVELLARALSRQPDLSVLIVTGEATLESSIQAMGRGAMGYLPKPVDPQVLVAEVREASEKHQLKAKNRMLIDQLTEENRRFRAVCNCMADGLLTMTGEGLIEKFNRRAAEITGIPQESAVGFNVGCVLVMTNVDLMQVLSKAGDSASPFRLRDQTLVTRQGREVPIDLALAPIEGGEKGERGWVMSFRDITEEKELQAQLVMAGRMAAIGTLAAGVAHEINNPLQIIQGWASILNDTGEKSPVAAKAFDKILRAVSRCGTIVHSLSQAATPLTGAVRLIFVKDVLEKTLDLFRHELPVKRIRLSVEISEALPPLCASENEMQQIFLNLLMNARDAMPDGGDLTIRATTTGNDITIEFTDTGVGIPLQFRDRIFDSFFTTKGPNKGTGLGLYIVYALVCKYSGEIHVKSEVGEGTTMSIRFPAATATPKVGAAVVFRDSQVPEAAMPPAPEVKPVTYPNGVKILLADDENEIVTIVTRILKREGHLVTGFLSGKEVLEVFQKDPDGYDLVLLDVSMPEMDGWETMTRIRRINPTIPVVIITGFLDADPSKANELGNGPFQILTKPVEAERLLRVVDEISRHRQ